MEGKKGLGGYLAGSERQIEEMMQLFPEGAAL